MNPYYYGTRANLNPGDSIEPSASLREGLEPNLESVLLTPNLDEAIWEAEIGDGEEAPRVYVVEPTGSVAHAGDSRRKALGHPAMSFYSTQPLRVVGEVTVWTLYHGTRADLKIGDLIGPGYTANFGNRVRASNYVYFTRTLDAATWGAELASGEAPGRIYIVEPTGPIEDDPNLTNKKFRGNPTKSFRSREPLRVTGEVTNWRGHPPEMIKTMKEGLERLAQMGVEPSDD